MIDISTMAFVLLEKLSPRLIASFLSLDSSAAGTTDGQVLRAGADPEQQPGTGEPSAFLFNPDRVYPTVNTVVYV